MSGKIFGGVMLIMVGANICGGAIVRHTFTHHWDATVIVAWLLGFGLSWVGIAIINTVTRQRKTKAPKAPRPAREVKRMHGTPYRVEYYDGVPFRVLPLDEAGEIS